MKGRQRAERDRRKVLFRVVRQLLEETGIGDEVIGHHEQRVAVRRRLRREIGGNDGPRARPVVDDDLLAPVVGQLGRDGARHHVGKAARREADEKTQWPVRILLRVLGVRRA